MPETRHINICTDRDHVEVWIFIPELRQTIKFQAYSGYRDSQAMAFFTAKALLSVYISEGFVAQIQYGDDAKLTYDEWLSGKEHFVNVDL